MNSKMTKIICYLLTAMTGATMAFLQSRLLYLGYDHKGLMVTSRLEVTMLWILLGLFALTVLFFLPRLGGRGIYEMNFPPCMASGLAIGAAGALVGLSGFNAMVPGGGMLLPAGHFAGALLLILVALCRIQGKKPAYWMEMALCLLLGANLLSAYRDWNARPDVQQYAFQLLVQVCTMIFALHRARCAADVMDRRRLVFFGFLGMVCAVPAMVGAGDAAFCGAMGLYCAGGMCELKRFSRRRRAPAFPREEA